MNEARLCVYCRRRPAAAAWRPFCSERCRLLDLAEWADGSYRIPGPPVDPEHLIPAPDEER
ncbi:MAG: DNA gyrase inhibitor YacG [Acidobacteria bacterium]|nr:DNA gyrase inhibitor YacG [Acidobacteriota bacterium]